MHAVTNLRNGDTFGATHAPWVRHGRNAVGTQMGLRATHVWWLSSNATTTSLLHIMNWIISPIQFVSDPAI